MDNIIQFNNNEYTYDVILINDTFGYRIPNGIVMDLVIEDNIYSVFHSGYILVNNNYNLLENHYILDKAEYDSIANHISYVHDSNGRDLLIVKIKPKLPGKSEDDTIFKEDVWDLSFVFSIYDEDEVYDKSAQNIKLKIFKFRDLREQALDEIKFNWSTSQVIEPTNFNKFRYRNFGSEVYTGTALQDLIKKALPDFTNVFENWDNGATRIFYSAPSNTSAMGSIEYILDRHLASETFDNCFLKFERTQKWSLMPVSQYFSRALKKSEKLPGDFTIDLFTLHDATGEEPDQVKGSQKVPDINKLSYNLVFNIQDFPGLTNFSFVNPASIDSTNEITTSPVHSYNKSTKTFKIDVARHNINKIQKDFQKLYVDKMYGEDPTNLMPVNVRKQQNEILNNVFSLRNNSIDRIKDGRNKVLGKALAFSPGINFMVPGSSIRRAGRFISIAAVTSGPDTAFQNILQGEWFITKIVHKFTGNSYTNDITAIKPYAFKKIK